MSLKRQGQPASTRPDGNRLIESLRPGPRKAVLAQCDRMDLPVGTVLCEAGEPLRYAYFPLSGRISLMGAIAGHQDFETDGVGRKGMLGATLILDIGLAPQRGVVQVPCLALRMEAGMLQMASQSHPAFCRVLERYLYFVLLEASNTAGCIHFHDVGERLAFSLLRLQDHARTDYLYLTHQLLAAMLGVQRGAITIAASELQRDGIIQYSRGKISILDRRRLEERSCECYDLSGDNYSRILS